MSALREISFVICRTDRQIIALPVNQVVETTRALRLDPVAAMPAFMLGLCMLRGEPVPVIDLQGLLGRSGENAPQRYVVIRLSQRRVALAVAGVEGVVKLSAKQRHELPPLLDGEISGAVEALAVRDQQVLEILESASLFPQDFWPQDFWQALEANGAAFAK